MKILITGGLGYIGTKLANVLSKENEIYIVDFDVYENKFNFSNNVHIYKCDIRKCNWDYFLSKKVDYVYHLAGISNDPGYGVNEKIGREINFEATVRLFNSCCKYDVKRFIYPSSCSIYGKWNNGILDESGMINPLTNYARNKVFVEHYIFSHSYIPYTIIRPATVYGYSPRQRFDLLVNSMIIKMLNNEDIVVNNSKDVRPSVCIDDLVYIYEKIINVDAAINQVYNVSTDNFCVQEIFNQLKKFLNSESNIIEKGTGDERSYNIDNSKILEILSDFKFTSFSNGILELVEHINRGEFDDYKANPNYYGSKKQPQFFGEENQCYVNC